MPVLLVEHYPPLARALLRGLREEGIVTHWARDDGEADVRARAAPYSAVVVNWNVPRTGGAALVRHWRRSELAVPVLMLVPSAGDTDLLAGLGAGADAILPLPFSFGELLVRLRTWIPSSSLMGKERA
jgi:two-component system response regulator BasR